MSKTERKVTTTSLDKEIINKLNSLSKETRINKNLLIEEALEDLFNKYAQMMVKQ